MPKDDLRYYPLDLDGPQYTSGKWRRAFETAPFEPLREASFANPQTLDRDGVVAFFASMGWIADLPDAERVPLLDERGPSCPPASSGGCGRRACTGRRSPCGEHADGGCQARASRDASGRSSRPSGSAATSSGAYPGFAARLRAEEAP